MENQGRGDQRLSLKMGRYGLRGNDRKEKFMRYYETIYIINPDLSDDETKGVVTKFNDLIGKNKGVIIKVDEWGSRTLAYAIKKFNKGYYVLLQYCGEGNIIAEIERGLRLDERILQYQTVKLSDDINPEDLKAKADEENKDEEAEAAEEPSAQEGSESENKEEEK